MKHIWSLMLLGLLIPTISEGQILCTPMGTSNYCAGYDAAMNDRAFTITPLPGGSSLITESTPIPSVSRRAPMDRSILAPVLPERRSLPRETGPSLMERAGKTLLQEEWRPSSDVPEPGSELGMPFPE